MKFRRPAVTRCFALRAVFLLAMCVILSVAAQAKAQTTQFFGLGFLPNGNFLSTATAVADGPGPLTVVGYANTQTLTRQAFIWTQSGGMVAISSSFSEAWDITPDGKTVVGGDIGSPARSWYWTASGGKVTIGGGEANAVSADGSVVVGQTGFQGWRWTAATGQVNMPLPPGSSIVMSSGLGITNDGVTIVGQGATPTAGDYKAYKYTLANGYTMLPGASSSPTDSANDITPDGRVVVGTTTKSGNGNMARWVDGVLVTTVIGSTASVGYAVSDDGNTMVGQSIGGVGTALIWDDVHGLRTLKNMLTLECGLDLTGWTLYGAYDISADGRTIVGFGRNPDGFTEGYVAVIPEPGTVSLAFGGLLGILLVRRVACSRGPRLRMRHA